MGLFASRPEEPQEWAGIPSEPERERSAAELLADASPVASADFFGDGTLTGAETGGVAIQSISISLDPVTPAENPDAEP